LVVEVEEDKLRGGGVVEMRSALRLAKSFALVRTEQWVK